MLEYVPHPFLCNKDVHFCHSLLQHLLRASWLRRQVLPEQASLWELVVREQVRELVGRHLVA
jgi:hypothetical protein